MSSHMEQQTYSSPLNISEWKCQRHPYYHLLYISTNQNNSGCVFKCVKCKEEERIEERDLISVIEFSKDPLTNADKMKSSLKWVFKGDDEFLKQVSQIQHYQDYPNDYYRAIRSSIASTIVELLKFMSTFQKKFEAQSMKLQSYDQILLRNLESYVFETNEKLREALGGSQASEKVKEFLAQLGNNDREKQEQMKKDIQISVQQKITLEKELPKKIQDEIEVKLKDLEMQVDKNILFVEFQLPQLPQIRQQSLPDFNANPSKRQDEQFNYQNSQNPAGSINQAYFIPTGENSNNCILTPSGETNSSTPSVEISYQTVSMLPAQPMIDYSQVLQFIHSKYSREDTPFFQIPISVDAILAEEYAHNQPSREQVKRLFNEQNISNVSKIRGDGNCFFRSFFIGYLFSKIASMKNPAQEVPLFLTALQQVPILYPTKAEEVFGHEFEIEQIVNASLSYFGEHMSKIPQEENRLKFLTGLFNNAAFDFAMQILCKSLITLAAKEVIQKQIEPLYYYIDEQLILASVKPLNAENGSTEIFGLLSTYLNAELVIVSCTKDNKKDKKECQITVPTKGLPSSPLMLPLNDQGKPQQLGLWFKVGHYYLAITKEQQNNLIILKNSVQKWKQLQSHQSH